MKIRTYIIGIVGLALVISLSVAFVPDFKGKPWNGAMQIIPGKITAAFYDEGGEWVAFHNPATKNNGSEGIGLARNGRYEVGISITRPGLDKFMDGTALPFDKYYVGWIVPEEWLNYSVDVKTAGTYQINLLATSAKDAAEISLSINGVDKTGAIIMETTGHVHTWRLFSNIAEIKMEKGPQVLTLKFIKEGFMNVQYLEFVSKATPN
jgi:hypothetical protein